MKVVKLKVAIGTQRGFVLQKFVVTTLIFMSSHLNNATYAARLKLICIAVQCGKGAKSPMRGMNPTPSGLSPQGKPTREGLVTGRTCLQVLELKE